MANSIPFHQPFLFLSFEALEMASGTSPVSFPTLKSRCSGLSYSESVDFRKVAYVPDSRRSKSLRIKRLSVTNRSNSGSDTVELQPVSDWSLPLVPRHTTGRRKTRTVMVGNVALGSDHPIKIQTMTTSDTKNVAQTVKEVMRIADRGADLVRITVQGKREADACFDIKNTLVQKNYNIPLVADIHSAPSVALRVAECFDKICVNTGNFADGQPQFEILEYTDDYDKEYGHVLKAFTPLVEKCKKYGRALQIGTNHGSLSDRMMSYHGDSQSGMVQSAIEFALICQQLDYHNFVFSMKASNPVIMVQAYRLLVTERYLEGWDYPDGWDYPLHLGFTEAGEGEAGGMKSAIGIGALLQDGLGDTISVSLTKPPEDEIVLSRKLANLGMLASKFQKRVLPFEKHRRYYTFRRRTGQLPLQKEGEEVDYSGVLHRDGSVLMSVSLDKLKVYASCPSCRHTEFDLQMVSAEIRDKTSHLPGVSIAIMGCSVNGQFEMVDEDFGYLGGLLPGTINLFVREKLVKRDIAMEQAIDELIQLIKDHGRWVDPPLEE